MTVNELIDAATEARNEGKGEWGVRVVSASSGNPSHKESAVFNVIGYNLNQGFNLIQTNRIARYIPVVFEDEE